MSLTLNASETPKACYRLCLDYCHAALRLMAGMLWPGQCVGALVPERAPLRPCHPRRTGCSLRARVHLRPALLLFLRRGPPLTLHLRDVRVLKLAALIRGGQPSPESRHMCISCRLRSALA